jgi:L-amino acid N-acyltransferase YncA
MLIRDATAADMPQIQQIYAHHVLHGTGTFEDVPPDQAEITARFERGIAGGGAWLVASDTSGIVAFAYYALFRDRAAYRYTVENSIYVREDVRGQGVGKLLVAQLVATAQLTGYRQMVAVIGDSDNVGSIGMHASLGFQRVGVLRSAGYKFDRWLDVVFMQKTLATLDDELPLS